MKTHSYIRLSLLFPYVAWIILGGCMFLLSTILEKNGSSPILDGIMIPLFLYVFGITLWGIPYTLLAIILGIWSRKQPPQKMAKVFATSPLVLALLVITQVIILFLLNGDPVSADFSSMALMLSILAIVYGYIAIGIVAGMYKLLNRTGYIKDEKETPPDQTITNLS